MVSDNTTNNFVPWSTVETVLSQALLALVNDDNTLLEIGVNERSLTHRLAIHIQDQLRLHDQYFQGCFVDCEYNRSLDDIKRLAGIAPNYVSPESGDERQDF